jgi:3-phenylpropionate/cinnamic acid dioxygenase small subunit
MAARFASGVFPGPDLSLALSPGIYHDVQHFLFREAVLLDHRRFDEWTELLASDVVFRIPARFAREIGMALPAGTDYFHDDRRALIARIKQLQQRAAAAPEQHSPAMQIRRLITNVVACPCGRDEYNVLSYLLLTRSGAGEAQSTVFSAERHDHLRGALHKLRIVRREIVIDPKKADTDIEMYF